MEPRWYWKSGGQQHGPVTTSQLETLVRQNRIQDADSVRLEDATEWTAASEIRAMFLDSSAADTTSASAARAIAQSNRDLFTVKPATQDESPSFLSSLLGHFVEAIRWLLWQCGNLLSIAFGWISFGGQGASRLAKSGANTGGGVIAACGDLAATTLTTRVTLSPFRRYLSMALGALLLVAACLFLKNVVFADYESQSAYDHLAKIWGDLDRVQGIATKDFRDRTLAEIEPLQKKLEARNATDPRDRSGYWSDIGFRGATARANLIKCCEILREMMQNETPSLELNRLFVGQLNFADRHLANNRSARQEWIGSADPTTVGFVLLDCIAVGGFVFWWRRRARN